MTRESLPQHASSRSLRDRVVVMGKVLLAFTSMCAAAIVVGGAGCSSDPAPAITSPPGAEGGVDPQDGGACFPSEPIQQEKYDYRPPRIQAGACTQADIDNIIAF